MSIGKKINAGWYVAVDILGAIISWLLFYALRKYYLQENTHFQSWFNDINLKKGLIFVPFFWVLLNFLAGSYFSLYKKSRLNETVKLFIISLIGNVVLFFILVIDDKTNDFEYYKKAIVSLFLLHFIITNFLRIILLTIAKKQIINGTFYYKALVIGDSAEIEKVILKRKKETIWNPYKIVGYITDDATLHKSDIPFLGKISNINDIIETQQIDEVIIAFKNNKVKEVNETIASLLGKNLNIKIIPTEHDVVTGAVHSNNILGSHLIEIKNIAMPEWQQNIKKVLDFVMALILLLLLLPLLLFVYIRTKLSNKASAIYTQERIGYHGKAFQMYKFRSMIENAEANGPQLSSEKDMRITNWGKIMRKWRFDELPQLFNIIKGEMSFVGSHRPERAFYANQIIAKNDYYKLLYEMKPGLTSWGMVKYGYAENIEQMMERMQYDLLYAKNASLLLDFKIMIHTLRIIFLGKGK